MRSEHWCATDELSEMWCVEYAFEKVNLYDIETRGIDAGHKVIQVFAWPFKSQRVENGKERACWGRMPAFQERIAIPEQVI